MGMACIGLDDPVDDRQFFGSGRIIAGLATVAPPPTVFAGSVSVHASRLGRFFDLAKDCSNALVSAHP
jgi:hypothetical protein